MKEKFRLFALYFALFIFKYTILLKYVHKKKSASEMTDNESAVFHSVLS